MRRQIPESWDRWVAIKYVEDLIMAEKSYHKVRVTSIEITNFAGRDEVFCQYEYNYTTRRNETPAPGQITLPIEDLMTHMRDHNLNNLLT